MNLRRPWADASVPARSLEAALFSVSWEMAILLITCYAFLIYNHFRIPPSVNGRRPSTMTVRTAEMDFI